MPLENACWRSRPSEGQAVHSASADVVYAGWRVLVLSRARMGGESVWREESEQHGSAVYDRRACRVAGCAAAAVSSAMAGSGWERSGCGCCCFCCCRPLRRGQDRKRWTVRTDCLPACLPAAVSAARVSRCLSACTTSRVSVLGRFFPQRRRLCGLAASLSWAAIVVSRRCQRSVQFS